MARDYVVGFVFDDNSENIVLIKKNKPDWQVGFYNGVGGKIESNENPIQAMCREFQEEAGVKTFIADWSCMGKLVFPNGRTLHIFRMSHTNIYIEAKTMESEEIAKFPVSSLPKVILNLNWIIPLASQWEYYAGRLSLLERDWK